MDYNVRVKISGASDSIAMLTGIQRRVKPMSNWGIGVIAKAISAEAKSFISRNRKFTGQDMGPHPFALQKGIYVAGKGNKRTVMVRGAATKYAMAVEEGAVKDYPIDAKRAPWLIFRDTRSGKMVRVKHVTHHGMPKSKVKGFMTHAVNTVVRDKMPGVCAEIGGKIIHG